MLLLCGGALTLPLELDALPEVVREELECSLKHIFVLRPEDHVFGATQPLPLRPLVEVEGGTLV